MKWTYNCHQEWGICGRKFNFFVNIKPAYYTELRDNPNLTSKVRFKYYSVNGIENLSPDVWDKQGNIVAEVDFIKKAIDVSYNAFVDHYPGIREPNEKANYLIYDRLNIELFDTIEKRLNGIVVDSFEYLKKAFDLIDSKQISSKNKEKLKEIRYVSAYLINILLKEKGEGCVSSLISHSSLRNTKESLKQAINKIYEKHFKFLKQHFVTEHIINYRFSDILYLLREKGIDDVRTISFSNYDLNISLEDFLNKKPQRLVLDMLKRQKESEEEHLKRGKDLLFGLANGELAPNEFFKTEKSNKGF